MSDPTNNALVWLAVVPVNTGLLCVPLVNQLRLCRAISLLSFAATFVIAVLLLGQLDTWGVTPHAIDGEAAATSGGGGGFLHPHLRRDREGEVAVRPGDQMHPRGDALERELGVRVDGVHHRSEQAVLGPRPGDDGDAAKARD